MDEAREDLLQKLVETMLSVMRHVGRGPAPHEPTLSPHQVRLLFAIARREEGIQVTELADKIGVTPGAVTQFVDTLVEKDLVSREGDPSDRRIVLLKLTETARAHYKNLRKEYLATMTRAFDVLSDAELRELIRLFTKVINSHDGRSP